MSTSPWPTAPGLPRVVAGPPRPLVGDADFHTRRRADATVLGAAAIGAVACDAGIRSGVACAGMAIGIGAVTGAVLATRRLVRPEAIALAALAPIVGTFLALRSSPWVVLPDIVAVGGLLGLAATLSAGGALLHLSVPRAIGRAFVSIVHVVLAPGYALGFLIERRAPRAWAPVLRGLAIAGPLVLVLGALLGSADAVFASFFRLPTDAADIVGHGALLLVGAWLVAGLLRSADAVQAEPFPARRPSLGRVEARIVLAALVGVHASFALAQVVASTQFGDRVIRDAGLTYADHARSGFFQLLAVAAITLAVLLGVRACADHDVTLAALGIADVALTLVVVGVAVHRLGLYQDAYGLTMLRLASTAFAWWIGAVFLVVAVRLAGVARDTHWFLAVAGGLALVALVGWSAANPEAIVVRHDLARATAHQRVDVTYLAGLSDDAVPTLVDGLARLDPLDRLNATAQLCTSPRDTTTGPLAWNGASARADAARRRICG
jgi:hypothetical protein